MKKLISAILLIALTLSCCLLVGCKEPEPEEPKITVHGKYEMTSISGSVTFNGVTTTLDEDLYEYYTITLNEDGTALVESKGAGTTGVKLEQEGEWEYDVATGDLDLLSMQNGVTIVEEMKWAEGVITYETTQSAQGMTITMNLVLTKVEAEEAK